MEEVTPSLTRYRLATYLAGPPLGVEILAAPTKDLRARVELEKLVPKNIIRISSAYPTKDYI